jgi:hypothetical protein
VRDPDLLLSIEKDQTAEDHNRDRLKLAFAAWHMEWHRDVLEFMMASLPGPAGRYQTSGSG